MKITIPFRAIALSIAVAVLFTPVTAQQSSPLSPSQEDAVRALVLRTIRENSDVVIDAILEYQAEIEADAESQRLTAIGRLADDLENDPNAPTLGNPDGETVLIEFFDYNCPYCKQAAPILLELIEENPDLRIVMREWPILGPESDEAARASLAAREQDLYQEFHEALMGQPRANATFVRRAAEEVGLDYDRLQTDMQSPDIGAHLEMSRAIAQQLGISGTPTFLIGETLVPGLMYKADLQALISETKNVE